MLATSPDDGTRNGPEAVELAERACEATDHSHPGYMDTLAAAYAETRQLPRATPTNHPALHPSPATANRAPGSADCHPDSTDPDTFGS